MYNIDIRASDQLPEMRRKGPQVRGERGGPCLLALLSLSPLLDLQLLSALLLWEVSLLGYAVALSATQPSTLAHVEGAFVRRACDLVNASYVARHCAPLPPFGRGGLPEVARLLEPPLLMIPSV